MYLYQANILTGKDHMRYYGSWNKIIHKSHNRHNLIHRAEPFLYVQKPSDRILLLDADPQNGFVVRQGSQIPCRMMDR